MIERKNIAQPPDWWRAFEVAAKANGMSLSKWCGEQMLDGLTMAERKRLSKRPPRGARPKVKV